MSSPAFLTLPEELLELGVAGDGHFKTLGYSVRREKADLAFPYTPALHCKRGTIRLLVEVAETVDHERMKEWSAFGKSSSSDTRVAVLLPANAALTGRDMSAAQKVGYGVLRKDNGDIHELVAPVDLALQLEPPELQNYPNSIRKALGPSYEQINRGNWVEGFEDACNAVEDRARKYLVKHMASGRITISQGKTSGIALTKAEIEKMTLGALKNTFLAIDNPNHADAVIAQCLTKLNPDRILAAHKRREAAAQRRLRKNVGKQMWIVLKALKELT